MMCSSVRWVTGEDVMFRFCISFDLFILFYWEEGMAPNWSRHSSQPTCWLVLTEMKFIRQTDTFLCFAFFSLSTNMSLNRYLTKSGDRFTDIELYQYQINYE